MTNEFELIMRVHRKYGNDTEAMFKKGSISVMTLSEELRLAAEKEMSHWNGPANLLLRAATALEVQESRLAFLEAALGDKLKEIGIDLDAAG